MSALLSVAGKEFIDGLRNRWVIAIGLIFSVLAVGLAAFGAAASGQAGFTSLATTMVSLSSLTAFLIPLIALLLAYDAIVGEDAQGTLALLLTYPLSRSQLLAGKFLGHGAILASAILGGFGVAGLVIGFLGASPPGELLQALGRFMLSALLLGWSFVGFAYLASALAQEKSKAAGLVLVIWFLFVLVFDLALLALLVGGEGRVGQGWLRYLLLANPTDVFRLVNILGFAESAEESGLLAIGAGFSFWLLAGVQVLWVLLPFGLAQWAFARRHL
ncbi:ABC transporter permease subunit [Pseudomonas schmalbachii]|uniref:ABC transporter permease n=1 Tax=Pseudomonas schmalbachii TaxID=2816993 RepID=A0ABS3TL84_9PSED|nr:ABC transporter permease subunit [Pseudomonas schmalbachii]MBO3274402.1 ABC transporter permease [Pseudomonas schmalbachii]